MSTCWIPKINEMKENYSDSDSNYSDSPSCDMQLQDIRCPSPIINAKSELT